MKKHLCLAFILSTAFLAACGDSDSGSEANDSVQGETEATLGNGKVVRCDSEREGVVAALADGGFRRCEDGLWVKISESEALKAENIIGLEIIKSSSSQASGAGEKPDNHNEKSSSSAKPSKPVESSSSQKAPEPIESSSSSEDTKPAENSSSSVDEEPVEELYECENGSLVENLEDCKVAESSSSSQDVSSNSSSSEETEPAEESSSSIESSADKSFDYGKLTDVRDGKTYNTIEIGKQTWMAENLDYDYNEGSAKSFCYGDNPENCEKYGRLYSWEAAMVACPEGYHLPSKEEWQTLINKVGGADIAGKLLKYSNGWKDGGNGTNDFGFAILPAGYQHSNGGYLAGYNAYFWTSSDDAYVWKFYYNRDDVDGSAGDKVIGYSVRCLQDSDEEIEEPSSSSQEEESGSSSSVKDGSEYDAVAKTLKDLRDEKIYKIVEIGKQTWMAENLNFDYNEGSAASYCYGDNPENCEKYGRLYTWAAAMDSVGIYSELGKNCGFSVVCSAFSLWNKPATFRGACPKGWHLPNKGEWETLFKAVGDSTVAGKVLKSNGYWADDCNGTDEFGFEVLPAGVRYMDGVYGVEGSNAYFWTSSEDDYGSATYVFFSGYEDIARTDVQSKKSGESIRCLKD